MTWKDALAAMFVMATVMLIAFLIIRAAAGEVDPDSAILIDDTHQASAIICNRAIPPQVRRERKETFA